MALGSQLYLKDFKDFKDPKIPKWANGFQINLVFLSWAD